MEYICSLVRGAGISYLLWEKLYTSASAGKDWKAKVFVVGTWQERSRHAEMLMLALMLSSWAAKCRDQPREGERVTMSAASGGRWAHLI